MRSFKLVALATTGLSLLSCLAADDPGSEQEAEVGVLSEALNGANAVWVAQGPNAIIGGQVENLRDGTEAVGAPANNLVSGAVHAVVAHPALANTLWIGSVNGGIWRTNNALTAPPTWVNRRPTRRIVDRRAGARLLAVPGSDLRQHPGRGYRRQQARHVWSADRHHDHQ